MNAKASTIDKYEPIQSKDVSAHKCLTDDYNKKWKTMSGSFDRARRLFPNLMQDPEHLSFSHLVLILWDISLKITNKHRQKDNER